jgi:hypothetical protein
MIHVAIEFLVLHFKIGKGRMAPRAPVDNVISPIDEAFLI